MQRVDIWNIVFIVFFAVLVYIGYTLVATYGSIPYYIAPWEAFILTLASFRLTRFVVYDSIMKWFRDLVAFGAPRTFTGTIHTLVNCSWCTGLWSALVVATVYFAWPELWFCIFILALGGAASFMQVLANMIGWSAEFKKRATILPGETDVGGKCG